MDIDRRPDLGGTAPANAVRTARKLAGFALQHVGRDRRTYLDVGCGNGFITEQVAVSFDTVVGVDVEPGRLAEFRRRVSLDETIVVSEMPSEALDFETNSFDMVTSFEVLEHVENVQRTAGEIVRVLRPGGTLVVSVPQVLFPFENHGMQIGDRVIPKKIPLLPYIRPLHRRYSLARVFGSRELDRVFQALTCTRTAYVAPQFERAAACASSWEDRASFLRGTLERLERVPVLQRLVGVSMLKAYRKPA